MKHEILLGMSLQSIIIAGLFKFDILERSPEAVAMNGLGLLCIWAISEFWWKND